MRSNALDILNKKKENKKKVYDRRLAGNDSIVSKIFIRQLCVP